MKNFILKSSLSLLFAFVSVFAFSQNVDIVAYAETSTPEKQVLINEKKVVTSNLKEVIEEVRNYLDNNLKAPEMLGVYNTDMKVLANFKVTEKGGIENISISRKSDKLLGDIVVKELNKLSKIAPVFEDGKAVEKYISIPVVFEVE